MLSLSLSLSLLADAGIQKVLTLTTFFLFFMPFLYDEEREDPNTTKAAKLYLMALVALESISVKIV